MKRKFKTLIMLIIILTLVGCTSNINDSLESDQANTISNISNMEENEYSLEETDGDSREDLKESSEESNLAKDILEVHFIDVGQGDSTLIIQGDYSILIDGGDNIYGERVVDYIKKQGINNINYVIATHPHADHIGGLSDVINAFEIDKVIMPKVAHTTRTYEDFLLAIKNNGLKIKAPKVGDRYTLGNSDFIIISPASESYNNLNDYSVGIKLNHGYNSFIFTGDAEATSENEMVNSGIDLRANVLKVPHHGSSSSSTDNFLKAVNSKIAIFSLGEENSYGHPHSEIIKKYENIETYRTDIDGTILLISNGIEVIVKTEKNSESNISENKESENKNNAMFYIGNKNSKVFHLDSCNTLPAEHNRIIFEDRKDATYYDYRPCGRCNP